MFVFGQAFNKYGFKIVSKKYLFPTSNGSVIYSEKVVLSFQYSPKLILKFSFSLSFAKFTTKYVLISSPIIWKQFIKFGISHDLFPVTTIKDLETAINLNGEMVVTKNSKNNVIIMSMEEYKKNLMKEKIERNLLKAEEDIENGRVRDAEDVFKEWNAKYGI